MAKYVASRKKDFPQNPPPRHFSRDFFKSTSPSYPKKYATPICPSESNFPSQEYMAAVYLAGDITLLTFNELYALQVVQKLPVKESSTRKNKKSLF